MAVADLGYVAILGALIFSAFGVVAALLGRDAARGPFAASARRAAWLTGAFLLLASALLAYAFYSHDFRLAYVTGYSSLAMGRAYTSAAFYAGNEGSLLAITTLLAVLAAAVALVYRRRHADLMPYVTATLLTIVLLLVALMVFLANPFAKLPFAPADGRGLNPLLEHPAMTIHPPLMMGGLIGLSVPFAFAIAALASRNTGGAWLDAIRRWTLLPWLALGLANLLGGWWAYAELGWGGYWGWDPVENAGIMPWLVATAFLHSTIIQRKRGMLKVWNMVLIFLAFHLAVFGIFLDRSGVLSSVHTFGESTIGRPILGFLIASSLLSGFLLVTRLRDLRGGPPFEGLLSRERIFLANNALLLALTLVVLTGTVFPWIAEAARGVKILVGADFFNPVAGPILVVVLALMGIGPLIPWRNATRGAIRRNLALPMLAGIAVAGVLALLGVRHGWTLVVIAAAVLVPATILQEWVRGTRARVRGRAEAYPLALLRLIAGNRPRYGGYIVHLAFALMAVGVAGSTFYQVEHEETMSPGDSLQVEQYVLRYDGMDRYATADKMVASAAVSVFEDGVLVGQLRAEKYLQRSMNLPVTEIGIRSTLRDDLYIVPLAFAESGATTFKIFVNPLVNWIWIGGFLFLAGSLIALWPGERAATRPARPT